jgi:hypothetical protein
MDFLCGSAISLVPPGTSLCVLKCLFYHILTEAIIKEVTSSVYGLNGTTHQHTAGMQAITCASTLRQKNNCLRCAVWACHTSTPQVPVLPKEMNIVLLMYLHPLVIMIISSLLFTEHLDGEGFQVSWDHSSQITHEKDRNTSIEMKAPDIPAGPCSDWGSESCAETCVLRPAPWLPHGEYKC